MKTNVADEESVKNLVKSTVEKFGKIHVVLNSAGIIHAKTMISKYSSNKPFLKPSNRSGLIPSEDFHKIFLINVFGTFTVSKYCAEQMSKQEPEDGERGVIVNVASIAGIEGQRGQVLYGGTKGAILGMTLPMARDLARFQIRVVTLAPGLFL